MCNTFQQPIVNALLFAKSFIGACKHFGRKKSAIPVTVMDLSSKTKVVLRSLLFSSPRSMTVTDLENDYLKYEGHNIPFNRLGYQNLKQYLLSIPDILTIKYFDEVEPVTANSRSEHIHKYVSEFSSAEGNRMNIRYGYQRPHPRIRLNYSPRNNVDDQNDLARKMGHLELKSSIQKAKGNDEPENTKVVNSKVEDSNEINAVGLSTNGADDSNENERDKQEADEKHGTVPFLDEDDPILSLGLPPATTTKIPNAKLTELKSGHTYNVFVTEISGPWKFWFCLCDKKSEYPIDEQYFYSAGEKHPMKVSEMVAGNACLVSYKNKIVRAEFMEAPVNHKVKVCFVDYGTTDFVGIAECHRIKKYFASIPKRCFPGALDLIEPIESSDKEWKIIQRFCKMVRDKPLVGFVTKVDVKDDVIRMILIDTSDEQKDVIVNQKFLAV